MSGAQPVSPVIVEYLLRTPRSVSDPPNVPRRAVTVRLAADRPDAYAELQFEGPPRDVEAVRDTLQRFARGYRGAAIEDRATPRDLVAAMHSPSMQRFSPSLVAGDGILEMLRHDSDDAAEQAWKIAAYRELGQQVGDVFARTLPALPSFDLALHASLLESLQFIIRRFAGLAAENPPATALRAFADAAQERLSNTSSRTAMLSLDDLVWQTRTLLEQIDFRVPQGSNQVAAVIEVLASAIRDPYRTTPADLAATLESVWRAAD